MKPIKILAITLILFSFSLISKGDAWIQKANFPGMARLYPFSFSIGNKGYVGGGDGLNIIDFWEYDPLTDTWTQKANFPFPRYAGSGFSIGSKGYVGTACNNFISLDNRFWEFDPSINTWTQKADFLGGWKTAAVGFSINGYGYIGTGRAYFGAGSYGGTTTFFQYNPVTDTWIQKVSLPSAGRHWSNCFTVGTNAYVVGGDVVGGGVVAEVWEYNTLSDTWSQKADITGARFIASAFSICGMGYIATGSMLFSSLTYYNDLWQYDAATNIWIQKANYGGAGRYGTAFFTIGDKAYIGLGGDSNMVYNDFWEYTPDSACATGIEDVAKSNIEFTISPNPVKDYLITIYSALKPNKNINVTLRKLDGKIVLKTQSEIINSQSTLYVGNLSNGIYLVETRIGKNSVTKKFLKQ